jgi:hypothetical protein
MTPKLDWEPDEATGCWRFGPFEARPAPNGWRIFEGERFAISVPTSTQADRYVRARMGLLVQAEELET